MKKLITLAILIATASYGAVSQTRQRVFSSEEGNYIVGPVTILDDTGATPLTGSITLADETIYTWADVAAAGVTGAVASINGEDGIVTLTISGDPVTSVGATEWTVEESDPVWIAQRSNYATGTPLYAESYQGDFKADGSVAMTGDMDAGGYRVENITDLSANGLFDRAGNKAIALDHTGDATNSILMFKNLDMGGYAISNTAYYGDGTALTITESDPVWTGYLATTFTNTVVDLVESVAVTGAVTSINTLDGTVTIAAGDNVNITTNGNTLTVSADDEGMTNEYVVVNSGNVSATVTFNFGAGQVQKYTQTASVTNTIYSVPDTNKLWEMTALIYGNGLDWDWNTNSATFLGGDTITLTSNGWNIVYMLYNPLTTNTTVGLLE